MTIQALYPLTQPSLNLDFANTKKLDPRITFTRASSAKFYDGKTVAKAEENLLFRSQEFNNTSGWDNRGLVTFTADTSAAPDGTTTADTITADAETSVSVFGQTTVIYSVTSGLIYTASLFAKAGTNSVIQLVFPATQFGVNAFASFDLSAGTVGTVGSSATATIIESPVGSGWYRCTITATCSASSAAAIGFAMAFTNNNSAATRLPAITTAGTETILLWGAQLEQRSAVTAYTATTTQPITNYIHVLQTALDNVARFDHNPTTGESLGLFVEEQRTNLLLRSEEFSDATWTKSASTITANTIVAPDGTLTGDKLISTAVSAVHYASQSFTPTASTTYTISIYAKKAEYGFLALYVPATFASAITFRYFNLTTGVVTGSDGTATTTMTDVGNGWWRVTMTVTASGAPSASTVRYYVVDTASVLTYTGDGYSGIYLWGAQLEAGVNASSYIPTVASQVTRSADAASMTGANFSSWYSAGEGTLYAEARRGGDVDATIATLAIGATTTNRFQLHSTAAAEYRATVRTNDVEQAALGFVSSSNSPKIAATIKTNEIAGALNGTAATTDTVALIAAYDTLYIGARSDGDSRWNSTIKKLAYYPKALASAQHQTLTA